MSWRDRLREYTTFHGRLRRNQWFRRQFIAAFGGTIVCLPLMALAMWLSGPDFATQIIAITVAQAPLLYVSYSLAARRLHDIGLSAWLLVVVHAVSELPLISMFQGRYPPPWNGWVIAITALMFLAAMFWPSAKGENRFGPPNTDPD